MTEFMSVLFAVSSAMAGVLSLFTRTYEPSPRYWHLSASCEGRVFLWGGCIKDLMKNKEKLAAAVETFEPYLERWEQRHATGMLPPGLYRGASSALVDSLYTCGGSDGSSRHNCIHKLETSEMKWCEVPQRNPHYGPMEKAGAAMVSYNDDTLVLFGGYGIPRSTIQSGITFIKSKRLFDGRGWTNELHLFNVNEGRPAYIQMLQL